MNFPLCLLVLVSLFWKLPVPVVNGEELSEPNRVLSEDDLPAEPDPDPGPAPATDDVNPTAQYNKTRREEEMKTLCGLTFRWVIAVMIIVAVMDVVVVTADTPCGTETNPLTCTDTEFCAEDDDGTPPFCILKQDDDENCYGDEECTSGNCNKADPDDKDERGYCSGKLGSFSTCFRDTECKSGICTMDDGDGRYCDEIPCGTETNPDLTCPDTEFCAKDDDGKPEYCSLKQDDGDFCYGDEECTSGKCSKEDPTDKDERGYCSESGAAEQNGKGKRKGFPPILRNLKNALEKVKAKYNRRS